MTTTDTTRPEPPTLEEPVGRIAARCPAALPLLHRHRLDYCCGGDRPLAEACAEAGVDADALLAELRDVVGRSAEVDSWNERPLEELVEHLLERYHAVHREQLPVLIGMAQRVERVHAERPGVPSGLADFLEDWIPELEAHMQKEEQVLFPMILAGRGGMAGAPIQVMRMEHDAHGENLAKLRGIAHEFVPPAEACGTWRALYAGLDAFVADLMRHVHLENEILFPRALAEGREEV